MKTTIRSETEKAEFIKFVEDTEIKAAYTAVFTKIRRKRSLNANAYMWLVLTIGSQETGNDVNDLYYYFLDTFPTYREINLDDDIHIVRISSSAFNTGQMAKFIHNIRREFSMMGIATPDADSDEALKIYDYYREKNLI